MSAQATGLGLPRPTTKQNPKGVAPISEHAQLHGIETVRGVGALFGGSTYPPPVFFGVCPACATPECPLINSAASPLRTSVDPITS